VYCPRCGTRAADDARFCFSCGAALPSAPPSAGPPESGIIAPSPSPAAPPAPATTLRPGYLPSNVELIEAQAAAPVVYAGFWRRVAASIIDTIILWLIGFVVGFVIGFLVGFSVVLSRAGTGSTAAGLSTPLATLAGLLVGVLYGPLQESSSAQATFGKRALGIIVTDTQGQPISFWRALGRNLAKILSTLLLFIGFVMVAFTARKQGLHDKLAGTLVVRGKPGQRRL
jgi:uncharacterized RDD family membrane protein YckC